MFDQKTPSIMVDQKMQVAIRLLRLEWKTSFLGGSFQQPANFLKIKESKITRGHNYMLVKKQIRLDVRKYSFSQRTINVWNKLSTDCVHASSVNMFKNKIDKQG